MNIEESTFLEAGVQFGHLIKRQNPKMQPYILGKSKNGKVHVFNSQEIVHSFLGAKSQLETMIREKDNPNILFVGTNPAVEEIVRQAAINCDSPYVSHRWLGGFLTNFTTIKKRINYLRQLIEFQKSEAFLNLPKKKKSSLEKEINRLNKFYRGLLNLRKKPDALFIIGLRKEKNAVREAQGKLPIFAIANTDCDPDWADYPIFGNDNSIKSVSLIVNSLAEIIRQAKSTKSTKASIDEENKEEKVVIPAFEE